MLTGSIAFKLNAAKSAPWLANVDDSEVLDVRPAYSGIDRVAKPSEHRAREESVEFEYTESRAYLARLTQEIGISIDPYSDPVSGSGEESWPPIAWKTQGWENTLAG